MPAVPAVRYTLPGTRPGWELSEETMPVSVQHDAIVTLLRQILDVWARKAGGHEVVRTLAIRWDEAHPAVGVDPDVALLCPPPPKDDDGDVTSVRTWRPGHTAPVLAVEVVSETNPHKDYVIAPDKYEASGTGELWIFDPKLAGPRAHGGPFVLQVWTREPSGALVRRHGGEGPYRSPYLDAFLVPTDGGTRLRLARTADGQGLWLTAAEAAQAERAQAVAERAQTAAERDAALVRIAQLEAALKRRG
jgi:Uma2 family endonuclease